MRISDWSSDVCSSDLSFRGGGTRLSFLGEDASGGKAQSLAHRAQTTREPTEVDAISITRRSEARRVGKECVRTCSSRWSQDHYKTQKNLLPYLKQKLTTSHNRNAENYYTNIYK